MTCGQRASAASSVAVPDATSATSAACSASFAWPYSSVIGRPSAPNVCNARENASRVTRDTSGTWKHASGRASRILRAVAISRPACISISDSRLPGSSANTGVDDASFNVSRVRRRDSGVAASCASGWPM